MNRRISNTLRDAVIITLIITLSGCAMFRSAQEIDQFNRSHLKVGYRVIVHTDKDEVFKFKIMHIDQKFIYGEHGVPKIRIENIQKLQIYKASPAKIAVYSTALLITVMAFLVYVVLPTMGDNISE